MLDGFFLFYEALLYFFFGNAYTTMGETLMRPNPISYVIIC